MPHYRGAVTELWAELDPSMPTLVDLRFADRLSAVLDCWPVDTRPAATLPLLAALPLLLKPDDEADVVFVAPDVAAPLTRLEADAAAPEAPAAA